MGVVQSAILIVWQSPLSRVLVRSRLSLASPTSNPVDWVISTRGGRGETHPCRVPVKERGRARAASASRVPRGVSPRSLEFYLLARGLSSQGCGKWRILGRMQNPLWSPLWSLRYMRYGLCARSRELRDVPESPYSDRTQRTMHTTAREPPGAGPRRPRATQPTPRLHARLLPSVSLSASAVAGRALRASSAHQIGVIR